MESRTHPKPPELVINRISPAPEAALIDTVAYWLGDRYACPGQVFDAHEGSDDGKWRQNTFLVHTDDGGIFYGKAPDYRRSGAKYRSGRILDVIATIEQQEPVAKRITRVPKITLDEPWKPISTDALVKEVVVQRTNHLRVFPHDPSIGGYRVDEEIESLPHSPSFISTERILQASLGKTAWELAVSTMPK